MRAISAPVESEKVDRKAGFLTKTEREYLTGQWDPSGDGPGAYTERQEAAKRSDIKTRTRHAIADIALLENHGDNELIRHVIELEHSPDDIPTFYDETMENAKFGLAQFMIRLGLDQDNAEDVIEFLEGENFEELLQVLSDNVEESKTIANNHEQFLNPYVSQLKNYAKANDISKSQMKDAIDVLWDE